MKKKKTDLDKQLEAIFNAAKKRWEEYTESEIEDDDLLCDQCGFREALEIIERLKSARDNRDQKEIKKIITSL